MRKTILSLVLTMVLIVSVGVFAQSINVISVYPKAQFSSKMVSTSNFTVAFSINKINDSYYLEIFLTNVSSTESIKVNWQSVSLLLSGQTIKSNFEVMPPSMIMAGSYVKADMKLNSAILSNTSIISILLPVSVSNLTTTYEIRLQIQPLAYSPSQPSVPKQRITYAFKQHLWDFPLQWGTVNFNKKREAVSTTAGLFGIPFLACEQKNFFSPLHAGLNMYWGYTTAFVIIPGIVNVGMDYITNGGFYIGVYGYWSPLISAYDISYSSSNYGDDYYGSNSLLNPLGISIDFGSYY